MFKFVIITLAVIAFAAAKPGLLGAPLANTAPAALVAAAPAPFVTATSSQVIARNYNGIAHAPIIAAAAPVAKLVTPVAAPLALPAPLAASYVASPYAAAYAPSFAAPLHYAASPYVL